MRSAKYLLKRRKIGIARYNPFRPRQTKYGQWVCMGRYATEAEARAEGRTWMSRGGLYDWAIFHKGVRLTDPGKEHRA